MPTWDKTWVKEFSSGDEALSSLGVSRFLSRSPRWRVFPQWDDAEWSPMRQSWSKKEMDTRQERKA